MVRLTSFSRLPRSPTCGILPTTVAYSLSFSPDFFCRQYPCGVERCQPSERPTTVQQSLVSLSEAVWTRLAREVFGCEAEFLDVETVMRRIVETNTCSNLDSPVKVWIDPAGKFTVHVYDRTESVPHHRSHPA